MCPDIGRIIQDYTCGHCERSVGGLVIASISERQIAVVALPNLRAWIGAGW